MAHGNHDPARERGRAEEVAREPGTGAREALRAELVDVRAALQGLLDELDRVEQAPDTTVQSAVVTSVVTRTNLLHTRR
jgi:hypothetical protein